MVASRSQHCKPGNAFQSGRLWRAKLPFLSMLRSQESSMARGRHCNSLEGSWERPPAGRPGGQPADVTAGLTDGLGYGPKNVSMTEWGIQWGIGSPIGWLFWPRAVWQSVSRVDKLTGFADLQSAGQSSDASIESVIRRPGRGWFGWRIAASAAGEWGPAWLARGRARAWRRGRLRLRRAAQCVAGLRAGLGGRPSVRRRVLPGQRARAGSGAMPGRARAAEMVCAVSERTGAASCGVWCARRYGPPARPRRLTWPRLLLA